MRYILPIILIGAAIGLFLLFTDPVYDEVKALQVQEKSFDEALTNSKKLQAVRGELIKKFNSFSPQDIQKLQKLLPNSADNIDLIIQIQRIALQYGMPLFNIKFDVKEEPAPEFTREGEVAAARDYNTFDLEFSVTGAYEDFISFLKDLEKNLRIADVTFASFATTETGRRGQGPSGVYNYDLEIKTYWLK